MVGNKKASLWALLFVILCTVAVARAGLNSNFVDPTPVDNSIQNTSSAVLNLSTDTGYHFIDFDRDVFIYVPFDQGSSSTAMDLSTYDNDGTYVGNAHKNETGTRFGAAAQFDGANDLVNFGDLEMNWSAMTVSIWAKRADNSTKQRAVSKDQQGTAGNFFLTWRGNSDGWKFHVRDSGNWDTAKAGRITNENEWHHVVGTVDASTNKVKVYVNGVLRDTKNGFNAATLDDSDGEELVLGADSDLGNPVQEFSLQLDEFIVLKRALSDAEVAQLYSASNYERSLTLADGEYNFTGYASDTLGTRVTNSRSFVVDTTAPNMTHESNRPTPPANYRHGKNHRIRGNFTDANMDTVNLEFKGKNHTPNFVNGYYKKGFKLPAGTHDVKWTVNDSAGNKLVHHTTYNVSRIAPSLNLTVNGSTTNITVNAGSTITLQAVVQDQALSTFNFGRTFLQSKNGGTMSNDTTLGELGDFAARVDYNATENYTAGVAELYVFSRDLQGPDVVVHEPRLPQGNRTVFINVSASDSFSPITSCFLQVDAANITAYNISLTKSGSYNATCRLLTNFADNRYNFTYFVIDDKGNVGSQSYITLVDTVGPQFFQLPRATPHAVFEGESIVFNITVEDISGLNWSLLNISGRLFNMTRVRQGRGFDDWEYTLDTTGMGGQYNYSVHVQDLLGHPRNASNIFWVYPIDGNGEWSQVNPGALFDIAIEGTTPDTPAGEDILSKITLINVGEPGLTQVLVDFTIRNADGKVVKKVAQGALVDTQYEFLKSFSTKDMPPGTYTITAVLTYQGQTEPAVTEEEFVITPADTQTAEITTQTQQAPEAASAPVVEASEQEEVVEQVTAAVNNIEIPDFNPLAFLVAMSITLLMGGLGMNPDELNKSVNTYKRRLR